MASSNFQLPFSKRTPLPNNMMARLMAARHGQILVLSSPSSSHSPMLMNCTRSLCFSIASARTIQRRAIHQKRNSYSRGLMQRRTSASSVRHSSVQSSGAGADSSRWTVNELVMAGLLALGSTVAFVAGAELAVVKSKKEDESSSIMRPPQAKPMEKEKMNGLALETIDAIGESSEGNISTITGNVTAVGRSNEHTLPSISSIPYESSVCALQGHRPHMEDTCFVGEGGRFVAVFDGHTGAGVSSFLRDRLYNTFARHLKREIGSTNSDNAASRANALRAAIRDMDKAVLQQDRLCNQGSTAVAVSLHEQETGYKTLVSANVGDSRAILSRAGHAVDLTRDHKPGDAHERARIEAMGERVVCDRRYGKVCRVRQLAVSRAIGDAFAKPVVSGEADIQQVPLSNVDDEFILLASDGLWDVMSSQEAISFVHDNIEAVQEDHASHADFDLDEAETSLRKHMSSFVANEAIRRGSVDNVCVVIVWLKDRLHNAGE